jgi:hypothetical protein
MAKISFFGRKEADRLGQIVGASFAGRFGLGAALRRFPVEARVDRGAVLV